jgi:polyisoprenoid-binding protein YceI
MTTRYTLDAGRSRVTVQAFATGMLALMAHSPTFVARDLRGQVGLDDGAPGRMTLDLVVRAQSLDLLDRISAADRRDIEERMNREVLASASSPEIRYRAEEVESRSTGPGRYQLRIFGQLTLRGLSRPFPIEAEMRIYQDGLQILGGCPLRMSEFQIAPVTALGGAIKLKDELRATFELIGVPEPS